MILGVFKHYSQRYLITLKNISPFASCGGGTGGRRVGAEIPSKQNFTQSTTTHKHHHTKQKPTASQYILHNCSLFPLLKQKRISIPWLTHQLLEGGKEEFCCLIRYRFSWRAGEDHLLIVQGQFQTGLQKLYSGRFPNKLTVQQSWVSGSTENVFLRKMLNSPLRFLRKLNYFRREW